MTFKDLVNDGVVEWVDAEEEEDLLIAARPFVLPETVRQGRSQAVLLPTRMWNGSILVCPVLLRLS